MDEPAAPAIKRPDAPLFDRSRLNDVPSVPQFDLERYDPPRGPSGRVQDLLGDRRAIRKVEDTVERGIEMGGPEWYNTEPLLQAFQGELGPEEGFLAYKRYLDYVAAASPMSKVGENVRNASYYFMQDRKGEAFPDRAQFLPNPYGHVASWLHLDRAKKVREGDGWDVMKAPKPASFVENLLGNQRPVTVDKHATRLPAMQTSDPRWLNNRYTYKDEDTGEELIMRPKDMFAAGQLSMREAKKNPVYWADKPNQNEYGALERMYQDIGRKKGITPAQTQASAWIGGGKQTGLGSKAEPFIATFEDRLTLAAQRAGVSKEEALKLFIRGEMPLLKEGGPVD
jgi:hypothetical protein